MKTNYNDWFHQYHAYLKGARGYNDTNWIDIGKRYDQLIKLNSQLFNQQPYGVIGNQTGFTKLLDLMTKSNYHFEDIDDALKKTYEQTLRRAMGKMLVNTHAVIFHTNDLHDENIYSDPSSTYFMTSVPYAQLHFGERDEFIRQKLEKMYNSVNEQYIHMSEFTSSPFTSILGFSVICTINGFICNDFYIGFDEQGLRFKFGYTGLSDAEVIIYKLDDTIVQNMRVGSIQSLLQQDAEITQEQSLCIVDIYLEDFEKSLLVTPNFGYLDQSGNLTIPSIQQGTLDMIATYQPQSLQITVFQPKYFHELPGIYPSVNYMNMVHQNPIYTDLENKVTNTTGYDVIASDLTKTEMKDNSICTPPICVDRTYDLQFDVIRKCVGLYDFLMGYLDTFMTIGDAFYQGSFTTYEKFQTRIITPLEGFYKQALPFLNAYVQGAILTSLVSSDLVDEFRTFMNAIHQIIKLTESDYMTYEKWHEDTFHGTAYRMFVEKLTQPYLTCETLNGFQGLTNITTDFHLPSETTKCFNRPISEQCFMTLQYSREHKSWLFAHPTIKHFKGIENTFYIDSDLTGNEVFKFFLLYTDTFFPSAMEIDDTFDIDTVLDYDTFITTVEHHLGFVRYWDVENQLMKLSNILYHRYDDQSVVHILSDILRHRINTKDLLHTYWSDFSYDQAIQSGDNHDTYNETSERAPFSINYLFYTLSMMQHQEDALQAFFYRTLTDDKFNARYLDYNVSKATENQPKLAMNFAQYTNATLVTNAIETSQPIMDNTYHIYYGIPKIFLNDQSQNGRCYPYTFHRYDVKDENGEYQKFPLVENQSVNHTYYIQPTNDTTGIQYRFYDDIQFAKLLTKYLTAARDLISYLETDYRIGVNHTFVVTSARDAIQTSYDQIVTFCENLSNNHHIDPTFLQLVLEEEPFLTHADTTGITDQLLSIYQELQYEDDWSFGTAASWTASNIHTNVHHQNLYRSAGWWLRMIRYLHFVYGYKNQTIRRIRNVYLYFKKFYQPANMHQFKQLHMQFDKGFVKHDMSQAVAEWDRETDKPALEPFQNPYYNTLTWNGGHWTYGTKRNLTDIAMHYDIRQHITECKTTYLKPIETYIADIMTNYVHDLYAINDVIIVTDDETDTISIGTTKPAYAKWTIKGDTNHLQFVALHEPISEIERDLYFAITYDFAVDTNGKTYYTLKKQGGIRKFCEYAYFDGTTIPHTDDAATFAIYADTGELLLSVNCDVTFQRVGNTSDLLPDMMMLLNTCQTRIDLQNIHEDMTTNEDGYTVVQKVSNTNYEMLLANRYQQLTHEYEKILLPKTYLPGSIDRVYVSNQDINQFVLSDLGTRVGSQLFFKPVQILHVPIDNVGDLTSIGSRFIEQQPIYLMTNDDLHYVFPAYITTIDHSQSHGFLEARVDHRHAKWFEITDQTQMTRYLTTDIPCIILDDNLSNFLDEFNNPTYRTYYNPTFDPEWTSTDENGLYSVPGDPVYVQNHANYVYTRMQHCFPSIVPNRIIDDAHKQWKFHYMGWNRIGDNKEDTMTVTLLQRNRSPLTNPELYPILRDEPNDHDVRILEKYAYETWIDELIPKIENLDLEELYNLYREEKTVYKKEMIYRQIQQRKRKIEQLTDQLERLREYVDEPEHATTWFNVPSYDAAMTYLHNHRTRIPRTYQCDIRDIPYTTDLQVFLYDWEHKQWMDPSSYTVKPNIIEHMPSEVGEHTISDVMRSITICPNDTFIPSNKILIYFAYAQANVFDTVPKHSRECLVRFKPILSTNNQLPDNLDTPACDMYQDLTIRKHIDLHETYQFTEYCPPSDFSSAASFHIKRPNIHNGRIPYTPTPRFCHLTIKKGNNVYDINNFDVYLKLPFQDVVTDRTLQVPTYQATVVQPIDGFVDDETIRLICIQTPLASYDGNISSIMFEGKTGFVNNQQTITITNASLPIGKTGSFVCTTFHDSSYPCTGGVIQVVVTNETQTVMDQKGVWMKVPKTYLPYQEIPNEFVIVPSLNMQGSITAQIDTSYKKRTDEIIYRDNHGLFNPFMFYYNFYHKIRYPISNIRRNRHDERLTCVNDHTTQPYLTKVQTTHPYICRYALSTIPKDGLIDVTGYIPTPLSRTRYEFWVNGRQLHGTRNLIILSPTSFQLIHLTSLKNFELIELVDDMCDSTLSNKGSVYVDLQGNTYSSYEQACLSTHAIMQQNIAYRFHSFPNHTKLQDYTMGFITNPNNVDVETDIMEYWNEQSSDEETDYNSYFNIPMLNGIPLNHPITDDLGIYEIPTEQLIAVLDHTWKKEILTNPLFPMTHRDASFLPQRSLLLHVKETINGFVVYTTGTYPNYFSIYLSKNENSPISSIRDTVQIIPFVRTGVRIQLDTSLRGLWLHTTINNDQPIKIQ